MADFLPIGLGRDANGNVSGFQEIKTTDTIPENYLEVNNEDAKWNASGLQGYSVSTTVPTNGYVLTWDSTLNAWKPAAPGGAGNDAGYLNGIEICIDDPSAGQFLVYNAATSSWCPSTYVAPAGGGGGIEGPVSITPGNVVVWGGSTTTVNDGGWGFTPTAIGDGNVVYWDDFTKKISDTGLAPDDAGWNANKIQGVSASPTAPTDGQVWVYASGSNRWTPSTLVLTGGGGGGDSNATSIISYPITGTPTNDDVLVFDSGGPDNFVWEPRVKSSGTLTANKIIIGDSLGGVSASYATLGTFVDGNVIRYLSGTSAINDAGWGISQSDVTSIGNDRILQWSSVGSVRRIVDSGYARTDAAWNANKIYGIALSAADATDDGKFLRYDHTNTSAGWVGIGPTVQEIPLVGSIGTPQTPSLSPVRIPFLDSDNNLLSVSATSGIPNGAFFVASGGTMVPAFLPAYMLRYFGSVSAYPSQAQPAEALNAEGQLMYYDSTNERWTNTQNLKVVGLSNLQATNVSSTGTVQAATLSATNYLNLPSSTIVWASAGYATLAGSATSALIATNATSATTALNATSSTSALNAQQAPNNFSVTGNVSATSTIQAATLSATNYVNLPSATLEWYQAYQAEAVVKYVKNQTGVTLAKGTPVTVIGVAGDTPLVGILSSVNTHVPEAMGFANHTFGLIKESIAHDAFGYVVTEGLVSGTGGDNLNTNAFNVTDVLYVSSNGQLNNIRPPAPYEGHPVGYVIRKHANVGAIYVKVETTPELNDIVGFALTSALLNGDLITYDTATSTFKNVQTVNVSGQGKFGSVSATNISGTTITATNLSATTISTPKYPTYIYTATGISVGTNKLMFDMFNGAGSGKTLKVTRIVAYVRNTTTITGINQVLECYRTSSVGTGGTTVTESKMVTSDPALNVNITARNTPTGGASYYTPSGVLAAANIYTEEGQNLQERVYLYMYDSFAGLEECLTVQEGEGLRINTGAVGTAGVIAIYVYFITV